MLFRSHELFRFREWLRMSASIKCSPEEFGETVMISPCEAMMLYREEKLSGKNYYYDFSENMYEGPDSYTLDILEEIKNETDDYNNSDMESDKYSDTDDLLQELPDEYDSDNYDLETYMSRPIDPYLEGFVDRYNPVIDILDDGYNDNIT